MLKKIILLTIFVVCLQNIAIAQSSTTVAEPESSGEVWGYIFGDFYWKMAGDDVTWGKGEYMDTEKGMMGGTLRRLYLGYDYTINSSFSTRVLLEANEGTTLPGGNIGARFKLGYLQWNAPDGAFFNQKINVGLIPTPIFTFPAKTWGYRSIEKEALDSRGIGRSVDQGISYSATFDEDANYGFTLMVANGSGTKANTDKYFEYTGSVYLRALDKRFTLETMANYKYLGNGNESHIMRAFAGFETDVIRLGFELSTVHETLTITQGFAERDPLLYSAFYAFKPAFLNKKVEFFARYDKYNPDTDFTDNKVYPNNDLRYQYDQSLLILGANYSPIPAISIIPNIYINIYDDKRATEIDRKSDIVPRFTLYYKY